MIVTPGPSRRALPEVALSGVMITPYSDFLLHHMGLLGDQIQQGDAGPLEIRTPSVGSACNAIPCCMMVA